MILATTPDGVIGVDNKLPWTLVGDLLRFKHLTLGATVIMGSNTLDSLMKLRCHPPRLQDPLISVLPGRTCIVVGKRYLGKLGIRDTHTVSTLDEAAELCEKLHSEMNFIIGGAGLYKEGLSKVNAIELTLVYQNIEHYDARIEGFDLSEFELEGEPEMVYTTNKDNLPIPSHAYMRYVRKKAA